MVCAAYAVLLRFLKEGKDMKGCDGKWILPDCDRSKLVQLAVKVCMYACMCVCMYVCVHRYCSTVTGQNWFN
jgi:hypothetical protein